MGLRTKRGGSESRFSAYVETLAAALGHADRARLFRAYCMGLSLPGPRKSVEPIAVRLEPARMQAAHQSLHHFVANADWSDEAMLAAVRQQVLPAIERHGGIRAWIVDDTGLPKKGTLSVGAARRYCGQFGKQENFPGCGEPVAGQCLCQLAGCLPAVFARVLGQRSPPAPSR